MRILILDQFSDPGGAQLCIVDLAPGPLANGWEVHAAAPEGWLLTALKERGAAVHTLTVGSYSHGRKGPLDIARFSACLPGLVRRLRALEAELRPDVLYVNGPRLMPGVALAALPCATVFHSHNRIASAVLRALVRAAIRQCGATVIAASRFAAEQWRAAEVIYSGVDAPPRRRPRTLSTSAVGMIGRISPQKRAREFAIACSRVALGRPDLRFLLSGDVLFGDPAAEACKAELKRLAPPGFRFLGWREDVYSVLEELDLLVIPSAGEGGFPRVAMEAFAAGVPVLAHASGAVTEVILEGKTGFLLRSGGAEEIAGRIDELLANPPALARVAAAAQSLWRERFTTARYRSEICTVLKRLAAGDRH